MTWMLLIEQFMNLILSPLVTRFIIKQEPIGAIFPNANDLSAEDWGWPDPHQNQTGFPRLQENHLKTR